MARFQAFSCKRKDFQSVRGIVSDKRSSQLLSHFALFVHTERTSEHASCGQVCKRLVHCYVMKGSICVHGGQFQTAYSVHNPHEGFWFRVVTNTYSHWGNAEDCVEPLVIQRDVLYISGILLYLLSQGNFSKEVV